MEAPVEEEEEEEGAERRRENAETVMMVRHFLCSCLGEGEDNGPAI